MAGWFLRGATSRVRTTKYPHELDDCGGITPGRPADTDFKQDGQAERAAAQCPSNALTARDGVVAVDAGRCVHCMACSRGPAAMKWRRDYQWARFARGRAAANPAPPFRKSLHIRLLDAGSCDAVIQEIKQLGKPFYNMHRLGFFITPTPRHADVLMITGPITSHMHLALKKTYEAMPSPKWVMAVGNCALSGCAITPGFMSVGLAADIIPVDVEVPGCPPPPLAILHGLLLLAGREKELPQGASEMPPSDKESQ